MFGELFVKLKFLGQGRSAELGVVIIVSKAGLQDQDFMQGIS